MRFSKFILAIFSLTLSLILIEVYLQWSDYPFTFCDKKISPSETVTAQFDPILGWRYIPYNKTVAGCTTYIFSEEGYRTHNIDDKADRSKPIIIALHTPSTFQYHISPTDDHLNDLGTSILVNQFLSIFHLEKHL